MHHRAVRASAIAIAVLATSVGIATTPAMAAGQTIIDTMPDYSNNWDCFGIDAYDNTATYGQTVTVPADNPTLQSFTFSLRYSSEIVFRGIVLPWDVANWEPAGDAVWTSGPTSLSQSSSYEDVTFDTGGIALAPGQVYMLAATTSLDGGQTDDTCMEWKATGDSYSGGTHGYNNSNDTYRQWDGNEDFDLAFRAVFGGSGAQGKPASVLQQVGVPAGGCSAVDDASLNWGGATSGGWTESWAEWVNDGTGGAVCTRTLLYSNSLGKFVTQ